MKTYNHLYATTSKFQMYVEHNNIDTEKELLVRIHSGIHTKEKMDELVTEVLRILPRAHIIGCSTHDVIYEGSILENVCLISITELEAGEMEECMFDCVSENFSCKEEELLCAEIEEKLVRGREGILLFFISPMYIKVAKLVDCMNRYLPKVKVFGGCANWIENYHQVDLAGAYVTAGGVSSRTGAAALFLQTDKLFIHTGRVCGAESVSRSYSITSVDGIMVNQVEGKRGGEWYAGLLGKEELEKDPALSGIFPIIMEDEKLVPYYAEYTPCDEQTGENELRFHCEVFENKKISLGYFNPKKIAADMKKLHEELDRIPGESVFAYECMARRWMLNDCASWEVNQFGSTDASGALLLGEIVPDGDSNIYANFNFITLVCAEEESSRMRLKESDFSDVSMLQQDNLKMINYLLMTGNEQLSEKLEKQRNRMKKAVFFNEIMEVPNQFGYLYEKDENRLDKIALFSLQNTRMLQLFAGRENMYVQLREIYATIKDVFLHGDEYRFYAYDAVSFLIAARKEVELRCFEAKVHEILDYMQTLEIGEVKLNLSYQCALVQDEGDALQKAENAIQYGAAHKMKVVLYHEIADKLVDTEEEIHMLSVIREAIGGDGIVPYFQGIYDNRVNKITLYEALMRIKDSDGNIYYPNQFLEIAKNYNLYDDLSIAMVRKVMSMFGDSEYAVAINLNVQDIYNSNMLRTIFYRLMEVKHPENFVFELVESEEVTDYQYIKEFATRVHHCGGRIAIDDFGSGFSNLLHLIRINSDIIKIDGEIIRSICEDTTCREFIQVINEWCKRQKKCVIAEFVENEAIQNMVTAMGITHSQGYFISKPKPWKDADR